MVLAGTEEGLIEGSRGVKIMSDTHVDQVNQDDFDLIVLPGGQPGTTNLQNNARVLAILKNMHQAQKHIAAICAAPMVLQTAGILKDHTVTSHPSVKENLNGMEYSENRVVADGNMITSRSPGTALEFALKLVEILFGKDRMEAVNAGVLAKI